MALLDENAFGFLLSYFEVEDDEYSLEHEEFVDRFSGFRRAVLNHLGTNPPGNGAWALDLGHAVYIEIGEGEETEDPFRWIKNARAVLQEAEFVTAAALTHGSRWVDDETPGFDEPTVVFSGSVPVVQVSLPSEPLRRALYADAATRSDEDEATGMELGWGPGLYIDTEAIEAMGKKLKNEPTKLMSGGAGFFRFGN